MRACKHCGLSIGDTATFCPVCGTLADPADVAPAPAPEPAADRGPAPRSPADLESKARACERSDPSRAATLYRQAIVDHLETDDALASRAGRRDVQRLFDRLSLVLKRDGRPDEALEEIDAAAYLGLLGNGSTGTKAQREALARRRDALRRGAAKAHDAG